MTLDQIKAQAKLLVKEKGIKPTHAHEVVAKSLGFRTYNHLLSEYRKNDPSITRGPKPQIR